ncbi:MAG: DNA polymerase IV [candidate division BRC1 bacterium ADurb.BinA364]|nr:MAG: DNA polymerase IV [candidate division BRC1 bacterium ADurb.BinA364]
MPSGDRVILHVDMDAFFASVEQRDFPPYRGKPVIVGGLGPRGVVSTASYEARAFGVHSAMPMSQARRLCPKAVFIHVRMERYKEISRGIAEEFAAIADTIEPVSIDEAYLDLTRRAPSPEQAEAAARRLKRNVFERFGLTLSAGIAPCKFIAKIASDLDKPDGLVIVRPSEVDAFLAPLDAGRIPGVGAVARRRLAALGIETIAQLRELSQETLARQFGKFGARLYEFARGSDPRPVAPRGAPKSIGAENTFPFNQKELAPALEALMRHAEDVARRLRLRGMVARNVTLKLRYGDFRTITRAHSLETPLCEAMDIYEAASALLEKTDAGRRPIRLVGLAVSALAPMVAPGDDSEDFAEADEASGDFFGFPFQRFIQSGP